MATQQKTTSGDVVALAQRNPRNIAGPRGSALQDQIAHLAAERAVIAGLVCAGEDWLLSIFTRLDHEIEALEEKLTARQRALQIAEEHAVRERAA